MISIFDSVRLVAVERVNVVLSSPEAMDLHRLIFDIPFATFILASWLFSSWQPLQHGRLRSQLSIPLTPLTTPS